MRLIEIVPSSNNKQQLNEVAVIAIVPILLGMAAAGLTITDVWNYKKRYDKAEKASPGSGWDEIKGDVYKDAAFVAAGGVVGKLVHKGWKTYKRIKDAKKVIGDVIPLTTAELKKLRKLDKEEFINKWLKKKEDKANAPKKIKVKDRGKWTSRARLLLAPFGAKAANAFRKLSPEAQEIELQRLEVAKQRQIKKNTDTGRDRIRKSEETPADAADKAEVIPKKTKTEIDADNVDRAKWKKKYDDSPEGKAAAQKHLDDVNARIAAHKQKKIDVETSRQAEINQYRLGREQEISQIADKAAKLKNDLTTVPRGVIRTTTSTNPNLDALNRVVQRASKKSIKGTEHAVDAGQAISRGIENTL